MDHTTLLAILTVMLNEVQPVQVVSILFALTIVSLLLYDLHSEQLWELPKAVSVLLILLTLGTATTFALHYNSETSRSVHETFGPGIGPIAYANELTQPSPHNIRRLNEFRDLPVTDDIVHPPGKVPPRITRNTSRTVNITLVAKEVVAEVANGSFYYYWTYNSTVPGPILRVREGDRVRLTLVNPESNIHNHSIDLHAVTGPGGGAGVMGDVPPGERRTISFKATQEGFYVYHCATDNIPTHIAQGMYGGIIVQPSEGMTPVDEAFTIFQGEIYTKTGMGKDGFQQFSPKKMLREQPTYYTFNGKVHGITGKHQLKAQAGDRVRLFVANMGNAKTMAFHVIGEILDQVYYGAFNEPAGRNMETAVIGAGQAATIELTVDRGGTYIPVDHALTRIDRGAWGIMNVTGKGETDLLQAVP